MIFMVPMATNDRVGKLQSKGGGMLRWIIVLAAVSVAFAGRVSDWSDVFILREHPNQSQKGLYLQAGTERFGMTVRPNLLGKTITFKFSGISSSGVTTLRIYGINGSMVEDLSELVSHGSASVIWRPRTLPAGLFFATLLSGGNKKTVGFVLFG